MSETCISTRHADQDVYLGNGEIALIGVIIAVRSRVRVHLCIYQSSYKNSVCASREVDRYQAKSSACSSVHLPVILQKRRLRLA